MKKKHPNDPEPVQPDLKHDTMEYAASTDGDDKLDIIEEEEITADELNALEEDDLDDEANALNNAETDSQVDEENFLNSPDEVDELEEDDVDDEEKEQRR
jgi:hypothetical protein